MKAPSDIGLFAWRKKNHKNLDVIFSKDKKYWGIKQMNRPQHIGHKGDPGVTPGSCVIVG